MYEAKAASDKDGSVYLTGYFQDSLKLGNYILTGQGPAEIFVAKLDSSGNCLWAKRAGGLDDDRSQAIAVDDSGNCYISGYFTSNADFGTFILHSINPQNTNSAFYLAKLDIDGNWLWAKNSDTGMFGDVTSLSVNNQGKVWVAGNFTFKLGFGSTVLFDSTSTYEIFMLKFDEFGNFIWGKQSNHNYNKIDSKRYGPCQWVNSIAADPNGNLYLTGAINGGLCFDSLCIPGDGYLGKLLIAKIDPDGNALWLKKAGTLIGDFNQDMGRSITVDSDNNCILTGAVGGYFDNSLPVQFDSLSFNTFGYQDTFIAKLNSDGEYVWVKMINGAAFELSSSIVCDAQNNIYTAGSFGAKRNWASSMNFQDSSATFGSTVLQPVQYLDAFVSKLSPNGDFLWTKQAGGLGYENASSVMLDNYNNCYLFGMFNNQISFSNIELHATEYWNGFLAKLNTQTGISESDNLLKQASLNECYPNPFNNSAIISYQLPTDDEVKLTVFNAQGQVVKVLLNQRQSSGFHTLKFNANGLNSGVYFYRLQNSSQTLTKRALLLK